MILKSAHGSRYFPWMLALQTVACNARLGVSTETFDAPDAGRAPDDVDRTDSGIPAPSCEDEARNGAESDIDCGGACAPCGTGASCTRHADCESGLCRAGLCIAPSCSDGLQNGNETGVDCGDRCGRCRTSTCNCASSPALTALACDETHGYQETFNGPFVSSDGQVAVFQVCHFERDLQRQVDCHTYRWTRSELLELSIDGSPLGISSDGSRALLVHYPGNTLSVNDGALDTPVPLPTDSLMSRDGSAVAGVVNGPNAARQLVRWTPSGGVETLAQLPTGISNWQLRAVSTNASALLAAGRSDAGDVGVRWTSAGGLETLGPVPPDATAIKPLVLSGDGSTVAGFTTTSDDRHVAVFRWTTDTGVVVQVPAAEPTNYLPHHTVRLSSDGSIIAGTTLVAQSAIAFRASTAAEGAALLATDPNHLVDMNADGSVIIGGSNAPLGFLWTPQVTTDLSERLSASGVDVTGWELQSPTNISEDGRVLFGYGQCGDTPTLYRWVLPQE